MELRKPAAFNRSVWFYDKLAHLVFGGAIRKSQVQLLSFIPAGASVLIIGGGTGWILRDLAQLQIPLQITYLEASPNMLAKARRVAQPFSSEYGQIIFRQGTEAALNAAEKFDIIFTPFVLDLYPEEQVECMLNRLASHLKSSGLWLLADFFIAPDQSNWAQWWQLGVARLMYTFFNWLEGLPTKSLPNLSLLFRNLALEMRSSQSFYRGFIQAKVYQKLNCDPK